LVTLFLRIPPELVTLSIDLMYTVGGNFQTLRPMPHPVGNFETLPHINKSAVRATPLYVTLFLEKL
jgi:hypothetical protein